jgi:hypothetical protein
MAANGDSSVVADNEKLPIISLSLGATIKKAADVKKGKGTVLCLQ